MPTPILYHGPKSRDFAILNSIEKARPISDPLGDGGLKVADSRLLVGLAQNSGIGDKPPSIVVGPLDKATPEAADALLKTLEDLQETPLHIYLWATHLTGVIPTIRSRTFIKWCPGDSPPHYLCEEALSVVGFMGSGNLPGVIRIFREAEDPGELAVAMCEPLALAMQDNPSTYLKAWANLRPLLGSPVALGGIMGALVGVVK